MTTDRDSLERLRFLARVVRRARDHLTATDRRLFTALFSIERVRQLDSDAELSERVEAFVARFGRLQDTLGDKLIPALLSALGERSGAAIDNLDRAERLGWLPSADEWMSARKLRNQMIHEYIEDPTILASALQAGHDRVSMLTGAADAMLQELNRRGGRRGITRIVPMHSSPMHSSPMHSSLMRPGSLLVGMRSCR